ncbi:MAG: YfhO family protein [Phycisphaerae bacterium]|nr:YfhO family protein [Phycisphaerae bacterium]
MTSTPPKDCPGSDADAPPVRPSPRGRRWTLWASGGLILLLSLVGYGHLLTPGHVPFNRYSDFIAQHLTTKTVLYESLRAGRGIPFWRNDQLSGYVALANPQAAYTYPLHFLFYLVPPLAALGATDYLHFVVAGVVFYVLGGVLELGPWPRLFMAAAGMFNFKLLMATFAGWTTVVPVIVWIPALLAATLHAVKRPGPGAAAVLALVGGLCLHCGQIQLLYYFAWFAVAYAVVAMVPQVQRGQWGAAGRRIRWLGVGGVVAIGLATYLLLPMAVSAMQSTRTGVSYRFFLAGRSLKLAHLLTFLYPHALGTPLDNSYAATELWEDVAYFGVLPFGLAIVGMVCGRQRGLVRFLTACFVISVILAFDTPILRAVYQVVPGFRLFRIPQRYLFLSSTFGICLAGVGLEHVMVALPRGRSWPWWAGGAMAAAATVLLAAEGTYYARRYLTMAPQSSALPSNELKEFFAADPSLYRVASLGRPTLNAGWLAPLGIQSISGYDPFNYRHYMRYLDLMQVGQVSSSTARNWLEIRNVARFDMLDALNVKYFVSPTRLVFPDDTFQWLATFRGAPVFVFYQGIAHWDLNVYRNSRFLERARWADELIGVADEATMAARTQEYDLRRCTMVLAGAAGPIASTASDGDRLEMTHWQPGRMRLATHNAAQRFLVVSEVWDPGWRARIDGAPAWVYLTNMTMLGLAVPPGDHQVVLEYVPPHWAAGCGISIAAAAAVVLLAGLAGVRGVGSWTVAASQAAGGDPSKRR